MSNKDRCKLHEMVGKLQAIREELRELEQEGIAALLIPGNIGSDQSQSCGGLRSIAIFGAIGKMNSNEANSRSENLRHRYRNR